MGGVRIKFIQSMMVVGCSLMCAVPSVVAACAENSDTIIQNFRIEEEQINGTIVGYIGNNLNSSFQPPYSLFFPSDEIQRTFDIDSSSGLIKTKLTLDRELIDSYSFLVLKGQINYICINITVTDINDNRPVFTRTKENPIQIAEKSVQYKIPLGSAVDDDIGQNTIKDYRIISGNEDQAFTLSGRFSNPQKLLLELGINGTLDYETTKFYKLVIEIKDGGTPPNSTKIEVDIEILDINDNQPIFNQSKYSAAILENATVGTSVLEVQATDVDSGENGRVHYSIDRNSDLNENFRIDAQTGIIYINNRLDYETKDFYKLIVIASDSGNQSNPTAAVVEIEVQNINELPANIDIKYITRNSTPHILENASIGYNVARVSVSDPESPDNDGNDIVLTLQGGEGSFSLQKTGSGTYTLLVSKALDREVKDRYEVTLIADESGPPPLSAKESFTLYIDDVNDHPPRFAKERYEAEVQEMLEAGNSVLLVTATDPDLGENKRISYHIQISGSANSEWFQVDANSGLITTSGQVDCEVDSHPSFILVATDHGNPRLSSTTLVVVSVRDINDKEPTFDQSLYNARVPESTPLYSCILQVNATDPDCGVNGEIRYFISNDSIDSLNQFYIEQGTGRVCIGKKLDHETHQLFEFSVIAKDTGDFATTANVQVTVTDVNDNAPEFYPRNYTKNIPDTLTVDSEIITVQASDADSESFGHITYRILSGNSAQKFKIDQDTGSITLQESLPVGQQLFKLIIDAEDGGGLKANDKAEVHISVTEQGSVLPEFERPMYRFTISEAVDPDTFIGLVKATSDGQSSGIRYTILSGDQEGFFKINASRGIIRSNKSLDHDEHPSLLLNIMADVGNNFLMGTAQVNITVTDINDNKPLFRSDHVTTSISEAINSMVTIYSAHATDKDSRANGNGEVRYSLKNNADNLFKIDATSGEVHLAAGKQLDYEQVKHHTLVIEAKDEGKEYKQSSSMTLVINVQDVNDQDPEFIKDLFEGEVPEDITIGSAVMSVSALDRDSGENKRITYSIIETEVQKVFGMFPAEGKIYLREKLDRERVDQYMFTVRARDHGQPSRSATATVTITVTDVNDNVPVFEMTEYRFTIEENLPSGTIVGRVSAFDNDIGNNALLQYSFQFSQDDFDIRNDGVIVTARSLDRELRNDYTIEVVVQDSGAPPQQSTVMMYVSVADVNDHSPVIQNSQFSETVDENRSKGVRVVKIVARDPDAGLNGTITYSLQEDGDSDSLKNFAIDAREGWITTKEVLDYEAKKSYRFKVVASDSGTPSRSTVQTFEILVNDDNDGAPIFPQNINITFYVVENMPTGTSIGQVEAYDNDGGENGRVSYYIISGNIFGLFSVDMGTGVIYSIREIDFEESSWHTLSIRAIDNSVHNPKSSVITIKIFVIDVNDNAPQFKYDPVFLTVKENTPIGRVVHAFTATDKDTGNNGTVKYEIINSTDRKLEIDPYTGQLKVIELIDYEQIKDISMIIKAYDQAPTPASQLFTTITVMVIVVDENDNAPQFQSYLPFEVQEDEQVGYRVASIIATDADGNVNKSGNNMVTYSIQSGNSFGAFRINENTGALTIRNELDRELVSTYSLRIAARDQGMPILESEVTIVIKVLDVNDNAPRFQQKIYQANVTENSVIGEVITKIFATDLDEGMNSQLRYLIPEGIANDYFIIDPVTGLITLATDDLDRETQSSYILTANVQDGGNPVLYDTATLIINVTDVNDNGPIFQDQILVIEIPENVIQDNIHTFVAHDADIGENALVQYSITGGNAGGKFALHSTTGILSCKEALDRETVQDYELSITASDGKHTSSCTLFIRVKDQNDNDPVFVKDGYSELIYEDVPVGTPVVTVSATDTDEGDNGKVVYSLSNAPDASMFEIDSMSGEIKTKGLFDREKKDKYSFDVIANDTGQYDRRSEKVRLDITIGDINDNHPVFQEVPYRKNVSQGMAANMLILNVLAEDKDAGVNGLVTYKFSLDSDPISLSYFKIDEDSGEIQTKQVLGPSALRYHNLKVIASDSAEQSPLSSTGVVEITVGSPTDTQTLQFKNQNYSTSLHEHAKVGSRVITVELINSPVGFSFSFASGNDGNPFNIDSAGVITVQNPDPIDYEVTHSMRLIVAAVSLNVYAYTTVWVNLIDINDNKPIFSQDRYVTKVYEERAKNTYVTQVTATDADSSGPNTDIVYNIIQGNHDEAFKIKPAYSGLITTNLIVDYEIRKSYKLIIEAKDNGENGSLSSTCTVKISVIDINDNPPKFPSTPPVNTSEALPVGSSITLVTANDVDISPPVTYSFRNQGNPDNMFSVDHYSGLIRLAKPLDHERRNHYTIGLKATDGINDDYTTLDIYVTDENDNSPVFSQQSYEVSIEEFTPKDRSVICVNATDADSGRNAEIHYSLTFPPSTGYYIDQITGIIYTNQPVVYRPNQEIVQLVVMATDRGQSPLSTLVAVSIRITSVNKYPPKFLETSYRTSVNEDTERGFIIMHVEAKDNDTAGGNKEIDYSIIAGNIGNVFGINQKKGEIILKGELDREKMVANNQQAEYNLLVMAKDRGRPARNDTAFVHIIVQDVNDQVPYFEYGEYFITLNESYPNEPEFLTINAFDDDEGAHAKIYFSITSGNDEGLFIANGLTGKMYITPNASLDYEKSTEHKLVVRATDCNGCEAGSPRFSNITIVHVTVTDVNEFDPEFPVDIYVEGVNESMPIGSPVFEAHANDKDGGRYGNVSYTLQGTNQFSINYKSGLVTTNIVFDYETAITREFRFNITAMDEGNRKAVIEVILFMVDVDEYEPVFEMDRFSFNIPGSAVNGTFIGRVRATDQDDGNAGKVVYRLNPPQKYFGINSWTGEIHVTHDLNREIPDNSGRKRREVNSLLVEASSGLDDSRTASVFLEIDVDRTCAGCEMMYIATEPTPDGGQPVSIAIIVIAIVSVLAVCLIVIIIVILMRNRRNRKTPPPSETPMYDNDEFDTLPHTQTNPPQYNEFMKRFGGNHAVNLTTSSDLSAHSHHSGSSGRGSAEDEEDEELAMINSTSPYLNNSNGFRKAMPDSGIQDDDNTSEPSVQNHQDYLARLGIDTEKINSKAKSGLTHSVESMHQFSDSGGGEGDGLDIDVDYTKLTNSHLDHHDGLMGDKNSGIGYHEQGPHMSGALSNVINSEEEYSGSYNWDYLLDWGPQYQPLAHVFSEIARLKDDSIQPKKQIVQIVPQQRTIVPSVHAQVRTVPPPMITNAPPKAIPNTRSNRSSHSSGASNMNSARNSTINTSLPSMPRSPISHESSFTSPALTPSFTPSLSPLATRSPSVSPVNSGRGIGSSSHSSGPNTPRGRPMNNNTKFGFGSSSSEQELQI